MENTQLLTLSFCVNVLSTYGRLSGYEKQPERKPNILYPSLSPVSVLFKSYQHNLIPSSPCFFRRMTVCSDTFLLFFLHNISDFKEAFPSCFFFLNKSLSVLSGFIIGKCTWQPLLLKSAPLGLCDTIAFKCPDSLIHNPPNLHQLETENSDRQTPSEHISKE